MAAAVADYRPKQYSTSKVKKSDGDMCIELERTEDILLTLGKNKKPCQILVGFAAETDDLLKNAQSKLERKNLDWIAAHIVGVPGRGFGKPGYIRLTFCVGKETIVNAAESIANAVKACR